jgi:iduronate 2-sulfatase
MKLHTLLFVFLAVLIGRASAADRPNVLLLCIDDLRPELACFGVDYIQSPNIDALAARGRVFQRHYVQAPTCGASRYTLLTGTYGSYGNGALFQRAARLTRETETVAPSLPAWFRQHGYTTVSVGKVSHHPGGRGGSDWDDPSQPEMPNSWDRHLMPAGAWQHPRGAMHGLANGEIRIKAGDMDVHQSTEGPDTIYPDGLTTEEALKQLNLLVESEPQKPFFLAVGIIRPHLPFGAPAKYMQAYRNAELPPTPHPAKPEGKTTWHGSGEFMKYNRWGRKPNEDAEFSIEVRKHYAACVTYADALVGRILARLDELKLRDDTVVVLWGDHGWHLGEHAVWGKHTLFEESLRSPLIVSHPGISHAGEATQSIVETIDVFPTLCELARLPKPDFLDGTSLVPMLENPRAPGHVAISYSRGTQTIRTDTHRLIAHNNGHLELYDHRTPEGETRNRAQSDTATVKKLLERLRERRP